MKQTLKVTLTSSKRTPRGGRVVSKGNGRVKSVRVSKK